MMPGASWLRKTRRGNAITASRTNIGIRMPCRSSPSSPPDDSHRQLRSVASPGVGSGMRYAWTVKAWRRLRPNR